MRARLLLLAAGLIAFGGSLGGSFHFDDYAIFNGPDLPVWSARQTRPLTELTFRLNRALGGANPAGYHALNLLLHLAAVLAAYECLRRLAPGRAALLAAAIFAVHPLQAETVDYVWGRSIVLAALFCFLALWAWMCERPWLAVAAFALALLAKEECAAFPLLILATVPGARKQWRPIAAMLALSAAAGLRVIWALAMTPGAPAGVRAGISPWDYLLAQGPVIWRYLRLTVAPYGFSFDPDLRVPPLWLGLLAWTALAAAVILVARARREWSPWVLAGFLLLIPSSTIFPAADLAADRRMYLPLFAFATAAAIPLARLRWAALIPVALTAVSIARTQVWMTEESLWREAVARAPEKVRPKIQLARNVAPAEALDLLAQAKHLAPDDANIATEAGKVLMAQGNPAAALAEFGRALALAPRDASNYNNRGVALAALGQADAARQDFIRALALDPSLAIARRNLQAVEAR